MHDKHQGSDLSGAGKEVLFTPTNFILKNKIVIKEINADYSPINTGERSVFSVFSCGKFIDKSRYPFHNIISRFVNYRKEGILL